MVDGVINKHNRGPETIRASQPGAVYTSVTTVAVGLICFNLLLDVQYISQTAGVHRTRARGSRPEQERQQGETEEPHCPQSHNPGLHFELFL